jgi:DNA-binding MarR family transcriptional regulator
MTPAQFLIRLRTIDKADLKARDVIILYAVITNPGIHGKDLAHKLGIVNRSNIQHAIYKLEAVGLIEDRREVRSRSKFNPAILHPTAKGIELWDSLKP